MRRPKQSLPRFSFRWRSATTLKWFDSSCTRWDFLEELSELAIHRNGKFFECNYGGVLGSAFQVAGVRALNTRRERQIVLRYLSRNPQSSKI